MSHHILFNSITITKPKNLLNHIDFRAPPENGDKLIIDARDKITLSRIDGRKCLALGVHIGINSATIEDLEALPGIGPKIAKRIIEYRKLNGTFKNLQELKRVYGIGERKFSSIKQLISLD